MATYFFQILCCLGKRAEDHSEPDERSRLIPASSAEGQPVDAEAQSPRAVFDRLAFEERLENIVRSKEGKMVNVISALPFNLHNKPQALVDIMTQNNYIASTSRSASTSTIQGTHSPNAESRHTPRPQLAALRTHPPGLRVSPTHSKPNSRSRSRSHSTASSSVPPKDSPHDKDEKTMKKPLDAPRSSILGVRLVRRSDIARGPTGLGRLKTKTDRTSQAVPGENGTIPSSSGGDLSCGTAGVDESRRGNEVEDSAILSKTPGVLPPAVDNEDHRRTTQPQPFHPPNLAASEFRIDQVGALSISWDD